VHPKKWAFYATLDYSFYGILHLQEGNDVFCNSKFQKNVFDKSNTTLLSDFQDMPCEPRYKLQRLLGDIKAYSLSLED